MVAETSEVTVQDEDVQAVAEAALQQVRAGPPPPPLPAPWILKESRSQPNYFYYYNQETGVSTWQPPIVEIKPLQQLEQPSADEPLTTAQQQQQQQPPRPFVNEESTADNTTSVTSTDVGNSGSHKRAATTGAAAISSESSSLKRPKVASAPDKVRAFHILKKHKDSRRPSSWRQSKITINKDEAKAELQALLEVLSEVQDNPDELKATFSELARTESDCSSAKRGGDLGWFGRGKMQQPFEEASFALQVGELSNIVESSSGVHIILRTG